jgi:hypothetical protein
MIRTLIPIDIEKVKKEYSSLEAGIPWTIFNKGKQASLQYRIGEDPWISSTGKSRGDELNFNILNPYFSGTVFEEIINRFNLRRSRLMWINPGYCYTMHTDATMRLHIPIYTNEQAFLIFKEGIVQHMPEGHIYIADTRKEHTAMNGSLDQPRLHFVGAIES